MYRDTDKVNNSIGNENAAVAKRREDEMLTEL